MDEKFEYSSSDDSPEAKLYRRDMALEARRAEWDNQAIDRLLAELGPEDATRELFTFAERKYWGLKRRRK